MKKLGRILTFVGVTGAALGGLWYFLTTTKQNTCESEEEKEDTNESEERSYVSLEPEDTSDGKEALKKVVEDAVSEMNSKAADEADGVGVVKEETDAKDFEFKSFDEEN